ncbi:MAG: phosphoglycerate dehydrogenase [Rhodospirillaceae bacterium]|nr:phosphoglycerate dehydrogenase [Rhodospirillaceae bacterium]
MSAKHTLLLGVSDSSNRKEFLAEKLTTDWEILTCNPRAEADEYLRLLGQADALVGGGGSTNFPAETSIKLMQIPFTGYDWISPDQLPRDVIFCNTHEHEPTIAEHVLLGMLEWQIGLMRESHPMMVKKSYNHRSINNGPHHREMLGQTVGIVGYGHIGREIARRCKGFGMRVMALSRTKRDEPDLVDWYGTVDQLDTLLAESDFVIVCAPLDDNTRGMIDGAAFAKMKPDAIIANVGRGEVIDEAALYDALASKRIRGGIIDVWYVYPSKEDANPWPSRFPFQQLDNVIMSPHNSAWTEAMSERRWSFVATNLDRFARGEELENFCFTGTKD